MENEEKFSADENENLRIENELIRIKMAAQYGEAFHMGSSGPDLPPEIENQFLKNMMAFEEAFRNSAGKKISVYEKMKCPGFKPLDSIQKSEVEEELNKLLLLLNENGIALDFIYGPYDSEVVYKFITEELFKTALDDFTLPGMMTGFIYEDFHPNNKAEIEKNTHEFFKNWINRSFDEYSGEMGYYFVNGRSEKLTRKEVYKKIKLFSDCYIEFRNEEYHISEIKVDEQPDGTAMGFSEGNYKYDAILESGELQHFEGPYKLYMRRDDNYWSIFYFVMPGFEFT
jgi:hypothetical protein